MIYHKITYQITYRYSIKEKSFLNIFFKLNEYIDIPLVINLKIDNVLEKIFI